MSYGWWIPTYISHCGTTVRELNVADERAHSKSYCDQSGAQREHWSDLLPDVLTVIDPR